jgi:hypothetical protein
MLEKGEHDHNSATCDKTRFLYWLRIGAGVAFDSVQVRAGLDAEGPVGFVGPMPNVSVVSLPLFCYIFWEV